MTEDCKQVSFRLMPEEYKEAERIAALAMIKSLMIPSLLSKNLSFCEN
jgi:hypothetical protein